MNYQSTAGYGAALHRAVERNHLEIVWLLPLERKRHLPPSHLDRALAASLERSFIGIRACDRRSTMRSFDCLKMLLYRSQILFRLAKK
jgi:hypothetical protein